MAKSTKNRQSSVYLSLINSGRKNIAKALLQLINLYDNTKEIKLPKTNGTVFLKFHFEYDNKTYYVLNSSHKIDNKKDFLFILNIKNNKPIVLDSDKMLNVKVIKKNGKTFFIKNEMNVEVTIQDTFEIEPNDYSELYKYVYYDFNDSYIDSNSDIKNERTIKTINEEKIYFPNPKQLNDIYDGTNYNLQLYNYLVANIESNDKIIEICNKIDDSRIDKFDKNAIISKLKENIENEKLSNSTELLKLLDEFKENEFIHIFSLTKKQNEILMWSHYANSNKGICIGYKYSDIKKFILDNFGDFDVFIGDVFYTNEKFRIKDITYIDYFYSSKLQQQIPKVSLAFFKSNVWKYEKEVRIAVLNTKNKSFDQNVSLKPSSIIFGPSWTDDRIDKFINNQIKNKNINYYKTRVDSKKYNLIVENYPFHVS